MKRLLILSLFLFSCASPSTGFFGKIDDLTVDNAREVRIDLNLDSTVGKENRGGNTTCFKRDGTALPDWGIDTYYYTGYEDLNILENIFSRFGVDQKQKAYDQYVIRFETPFPPPAGWPSSSREQWEYGLWLFEQGEYDNVICRHTVFFIEEGDIYNEDTGRWDRTKWHELEHIDF